MINKSPPDIALFYALWCLSNWEGLIALAEYGIAS